MITFLCANCGDVAILLVAHHHQVSIIEPGFMKTPIVTGAASMLQRMAESLPAATRARYAPDFIERAVGSASKVPAISGHPQQAVNAMRHAIGAATPRHRYSAGQAQIISTTFLLELLLLQC
jgi:hypothetical protein